MKILNRTFLTMILMTLSIGAWAEISVIVNPGNMEASLSADQVKKIYLGKAKSFPGGGAVKAVDYQEGHALRSTFYSSVVGKSESQAKAYWSKLVFTGKGTPPQAMGSEADVLSFVAANPGALGYVDSGSVDGSVKVVLTVP